MGKLVVLEGLDGAGKSTQIRLLQERLEREGVPFLRMKAPDYDSPSSALVTMYLNGDFGSSPDDVNAYAASTFYAADRYACYKAKWGSAYREGSVILADRYTTSNAIFQMPKLSRQLWDQYLGWLQDFEYKKLGLPQPDLVLYLDIPVEVSQKLLEKRYAAEGGAKDVHERDTEYQQNCREAAAYAARSAGWTRISCAENGEMRSPEAIAADIYAAVRPLLEEDSSL